MARCHFAVLIGDTLKNWRAARQRVLRRNAARSAVHAWRICSRQLFALEALLAPNTPGTLGASLHNQLHRAFHHSGKLRDSQVAIPRLEQLALTYPAATRLARHLHRQLPRQRRHAVRRVRDVAPRALQATISAWGDPRTTDFDRIACDRSARRLARAARPPYMPGRAQQTTRSLHRWRIRLKSLRYMMEICRAAGCNAHLSGVTPRKLAGLQSALGEIMDIQVLLKCIEEYGQRHHRWRRQVAPLRAHLRYQRIRLVERLL
jgi:CHAD domain-containing protein